MTLPTSPTRCIRTPYLRTRRWLFLGLVTATTLAATVMMVDIVRAAGITRLEIVILVLFVTTFSWITIAFWNAVLGFVLQLLGRDPLSLERIQDLEPDDSPLVTRTALVMPAHDEDPERLTDGLTAMIRSLEETGQADHFDLHLLSDTVDAGRARAEESAWIDMRRKAPRPDALYYRRHPTNTGRKAGNIADFCERWGDGYDFMVVLDADSVMSGATLVELVRAMQANPRAGLIQTVPIPSRQETLFGRFTQFAAGLYSPMLAWGQSFWHAESANYWGHNAILRMGPFIEHCRLPVLPGRPPLGGAILSHDFVEAALLRRGGWLVYLLPQLEGSHEEVPANIIDFAKRDHRWAQGSLQHLRLLWEPGFACLSRLHFLMGAMGYLSSVLWLLILIASTAYVLLPALSADPFISDDTRWLIGWSLSGARSLLPLLVFTAFVLFMPKALGLTLALTKRCNDFGGARSLVVSATLEACFAVLVAPLMMMYHTRFVLSILSGHDVDWSTQRRQNRDVPWKEALRSTAGITVLGLLWAGVTLSSSPTFFLWLTPILGGLLLSAPLTRVTSKASVGSWLQDYNLLLTRSETFPPPELRGTTERARRGTPMLPSPNAHTTALGRMYEAERGVFDLRRGRPIYVIPPIDHVADDAYLFAAVEGLNIATLKKLRRLGCGELRLIVTPHRAATMGVPKPSGGSKGPAAVSLGVDGKTPEDVFHLSSAVGPFDATRFDPREATDSEASGLLLARLGQLLPAVVSILADPDRVPELRDELETGVILQVRSSQIAEMTDAPQPPIEVTYVSDAPVPLAEAENVRFMLFREAHGLREHVAILVGNRADWPDPVPVRLHSACLTGDLFGSLRCDCGEQLRGSLRVFTASGGGVLVYLEQEGRGIGLGNKLRAYALQQKGLDTVDADCVLGFGADERSYEAAVAVLRLLGIERVRLLTNNPEKLRAVEAGGIRVMDRQALHGTLNRHNLSYVNAKVERAGHWLSGMFEGAIPGK